MRSPGRSWLPFALVALVACSGANDDVAADTQDQTSAQSLPLREVSGLANHDGTFVAIGDRSSTVVTFRWKNDAISDVQKHTPLPRAGGSGSQYEAVTFDGAGNVVVLSETGKILALSSDLAKETAEAELDWISVNPLVDGHVNVNSLGEGLVVLDATHVLVALEKSPTAIVEFGPSGEEPTGFIAGTARKAAFAPPSKLVALKAWRVDDANAPDLSELTIGPDGALWALSQQGNTLLRFEKNLRPDEDRASVKEHRRLPSEIVGAEGLTFDGTRPLVARDRSSDSKKNLYALDPIAR
jgi:uncharacterized protein YjiK